LSGVGKEQIDLLITNDNVRHAPINDVGNFIHPHLRAFLYTDPQFDPIYAYWKDWEEFWVLEYIEGRCTVEKLEEQLDRILLHS
jgi:hypothetical protein